MTLIAAAVPLPLTAGSETSLTSGSLAIWLPSLTSRGSLAVDFRNSSCCFCSCCCFAVGCGGGGGGLGGLAGRGRLARRLLVLLLLLLVLLLGLVLLLLLLRLDLVQLLRVRLRRRVELHRDEQRPVGAGAEALREDVVGLAGLGVGRQLRVVGLARARCRAAGRPARPGWRCRRPPPTAGGGRSRGPSGPSRAAGRRARAGGSAACRVLIRSPSIPRIAGQQRDRGDDRDRDDDRRRVAERADERDAAEVEREQGDHHGAAGEEDGAARRGGRAGDRLLHAEALRRGSPRYRVTMKSA